RGADRRDGRARPCRYHAREGAGLCRRRAGRGQCGRRLRGDRAHAGHVQVLEEAGGQAMSGGLDLRLWLVGASYLAAATLFLLGLQRMASPATARSGIRWAGLGMVIATVATFLLPDLHNLGLIITALVLGTVVA